MVFNLRTHEDEVINLYFQGVNKSPSNLTNHTITLTDFGEFEESDIDLDITNAAVGHIRLIISWSDTFITHYVRNPQMFFTVLAENDGHTRSSGRLEFIYTDNPKRELPHFLQIESNVADFEIRSKEVLYIDRGVFDDTVDDYSKNSVVSTETGIYIADKILSTEYTTVGIDPSVNTEQWSLLATKNDETLLEFRGTWSALIDDYTVNTLVSYNDTIYVSDGVLEGSFATLGEDPIQNTDQWTKVLSNGSVKATGGEWDVNYSTYVPQSLVTYAGSLYIADGVPLGSFATQGSTPVTNTAHWTLVAALSDVGYSQKDW